MEKIIQEKISADHLLYVSLKYTKTTDVILNLIHRWRSLIDEGFDKILAKSKKTKKISRIPTAPKLKVEAIISLYKKDEIINQTIDLYNFFKKLQDSEKIRENEFRKNVALRVMYLGKWITIDLDKLKEYNSIIEKFVDRLRAII